MYIYIHICIYIYICTFEIGVLGTSACASVYVTWVLFDINIHICEHTCCRVCACAGPYTVLDA